MSKKAAPDAADGEKKGKKKGNLLPAIVLAVGLLGGGYLMQGGSAKPAATSVLAGATGPAASTTVPSNGVSLDAASQAVLTKAGIKPLATDTILKFDDITLNLSDGHFLKLGLALQLTKKAKPDSYTTGGSASKAFDLAITLFGNRSYKDLTAPGARDAAKSELTNKVIVAYDGEVDNLYFTDFVMQ